MTQSLVIVESPAKGKTIELGPGVVEIHTTLRIKATDALLVHPGTTLLLAPGVSIISHGRVYLGYQALVIFLH